MEIIPRHIAIIKCSAIGDILQALPIVKAIKLETPSAKISWIVDEKHQDLLATFKEIDEIIPLPLENLKKGIFSAASWIYHLKKELSKKRFDAVCDLQGNCKSALITWACKSKIKLGFSKEAVSEWPNLLTSNIKVFVKKGTSIQEQYLCFAKKLLNKSISFDHDNSSFDEPSTRRIMVCPGSQWKNKRLDTPEFFSFLKSIEKKYKLTWIIVGIEKNGLPLLNNALFYPQLEWSLWKEMMRNVDMVLSADSCALHLAALLERPTLSFFGPSSAAIYQPRGPLHASLSGSCPYGKTFTKRCKVLRTCPTGACLKQLSSQEYEKIFTQHFETLFNKRSKST